MAQFGTKQTYRVEAHEFSGTLIPMSTGDWFANIRYKTGDRATFRYQFSSEAAMKRELSARSKYQVRFIVENLGNKKADAVEQARQKMLETNPRRNDPRSDPRSDPRVAAPIARKPAGLEDIGFTKEESEVLIDDLWTVAVTERPWLHDCSENRGTITKYLQDHSLATTHKNLGDAIRACAESNFLIKEHRLRGEPEIARYKSPVPIAEVNTIQPESLPLAELARIETHRQVAASSRRIQKARFGQAGYRRKTLVRGE
jgi:hypothetical protein